MSDSLYRRAPSPLAGKTIPVIKGSLAGQEFKVEDWWMNVSGVSWKISQGPAAFIYSRRAIQEHLPLNDDVLYGKIGGAGHLIHLMELEN